MKIPDVIKEIFKNEECHQLATASLDGIPNICNIGAKYLRGDAIVVVNNYMKKTISNILSNSNVSILIRRGRSSYQLKGKCRYVSEGAEYEEARNWMKSIGEQYPAKGALIITIDAIFNSASGPDAGKSIA